MAAFKILTCPSLIFFLIQEAVSLRYASQYERNIVHNGDLKHT